ncbi:FIST signal transduction protein [Azonexus sp. IMCC34839]|uniref:FIST signal transduction protein n=1 Tax=Azonexus sp. IMCC34839 TaxID=3133695 RepID=UPI00399C10CF
MIQEVVNSISGLSTALGKLKAADPEMLLVFGDVSYFSDATLHDAVRATFPASIAIGCSTAGEITAHGVDNGTLTLTAVHFDDVPLRQASIQLPNMSASFEVGESLAKELNAPDLKAILLFGPGTQINGSALVRGVAGVVGEKVVICGGLAGDGGAFKQTFTLGRDGVGDRSVVAVGMYGDRLSIGHGSFGGWEPFGPARRVTRSEGNILYELDGEPALAVYKRYLGEHAKGLPASGLLFPFAMLTDDHQANGLIRTILGVDEATGSLTLAGEVQQDGYLKLMHASTDKLVDGAENAAEAAASMLETGAASLAVLVSCVGRKLVMGQRVDEEVEAVVDVLGKHTVLSGFYSYGEISPFAPEGACRLHNQTMTISCLSED